MTSAARGRFLSRGLAALLLIILIGAGLRTFRLSRESFWMEEAFSLELARGSLSYMVDRTAHDAHPPLYYAALHYWRLPFGDSEGAVRMLSVLFAVLTIPALYRLTKRLYDEPTALLAALFCALSIPHLAVSQESRMQSLLVLLTVLSMDYFYQLTAGARGRAFAGYVVSSALMLYTQYYGFFTLAAQAAFLLIVLLFARDVGRRVWRRCVAGQALAVILFLPWVPVFVRQLSGVEQSFWILKVKLRGLLYGISEYAGPDALGRIVRPLALGAAVVGVVRPEPKGEAPFRLATWLLLTWIAATTVLPWAISQVSSPIFLPRYGVSAALALLVLAARGVTWLPGRSTQIAAGALVVALSVAELPTYFTGVRKDQWRPAVARLEASAQPGDLVLFNWGAGKMPFDYYSRRRDLVEVPIDDHSAAPTDATALATVTAAIGNHQRVWLMLSHTNPVGPAALTYLETHFHEQSQSDDTGVMTYLFVR